MRLDPGIRALLMLSRWRKPTYLMSLDKIQQSNQTKLSPLLSWLVLGAKPAMVRIVDKSIPGRHGDIPIRLYFPSLGEALPLVVFFHGGGWVTGSLETHDVVCRRVANEAGAVVAAVDYRLAPWHRFPVPVEDCYDATCWLVDQADRLSVRNDCVMVMGDSAGGNMATVVCMMARDQQGPTIARQVLVYPAVDGTRSCPSHRRYPDAPLLPEAAMDFFLDCYARHESDLKSPYFSPLLAEDVSQLPPALIQAAEYDPLHDEAAAYAEKLKAAGTEVQYSDYPGMIHAFLNFPRFCRAARLAFAEIAAFIKAAADSP